MGGEKFKSSFMSLCVCVCDLLALRDSKEPPIHKADKFNFTIGQRVSRGETEKHTIEPIE
ncbi:hypothetical protein TSAR_007523 [Trichomalopsis sarcophagae]|uniref:Uncharacterized protein n=1 Tax=Trichomalopsis sarcophagae TaxID=543379 RepID=A0A232EVV9_9HYME|nr:hypothetical protein TSAR_007523 [Trichomalopsis sarcophagae]